jgi:hypothetical protein
MRDKGESAAAKYSGLISALRQAVLENPARTDSALRQSAATGEALAEPWLSYTAKVRDESWAMTDSDVDDLRAAGHNEDEIFEMTVAAAVGASLRALDAGLQALHDAE